jgi:hypothetical protein
MVSGAGLVADFGDKKMILITGWWFGTFFIFPYIGNRNPN